MFCGSGENSHVGPENTPAKRTSSLVLSETSNRGGATNVCEVCYEEYKESEGLTLKCLHKFCINCVSNQIKAQIDASNTESIACLSDGCSTKMDDDTIRSVLSNKEWERFLRIRETQRINKDPNLKWCPTADCGQVLRVSDVKDEQITCTKCKTKLCGLCFRKYHKGCFGNKQCEEAEDQDYNEWAKGKQVQLCPRCKARVEKEDGCNHMTCG
eukprot:TRINITY_DN2334_c0_g1_i2.p2 TRINITY_DN2334_c0_g1~~TRINITY_DN2334_c0_g1_i2.p2  ORF type:complete len:213 (+),score=16.74 TRINITY_DN2334_c0_g1_i2:346-984(+)